MWLQARAAVAQSLGALKWRQLRALFDGWEDEATATLANMERMERNGGVDAKRAWEAQKKARSLRQSGFFTQMILGACHRDVVLWAQQRAICLLYTSPSPRDATLSRMPSSA